jgi:hypothetical protein
VHTNGWGAHPCLSLQSNPCQQCDCREYVLLPAGHAAWYIPQPSTRGAQPSTSCAKPSTRCPQPSADCAQPGADCAQPSTCCAQPSTRCAKPSTSCAQPTTFVTDCTSNALTSTNCSDLWRRGFNKPRTPAVSVPAWCSVQPCKYQQDQPLHTPLLPGNFVLDIAGSGLLVSGGVLQIPNSRCLRRHFQLNPVTPTILHCSLLAATSAALTKSLFGRASTVFHRMRISHPLSGTQTPHFCLQRFSRLLFPCVHAGHMWRLQSAAGRTSALPLLHGADLQPCCGSSHPALR